jgi:menaquinol-cytochrome c reductase iron-sulfur subunit
MAPRRHPPRTSLEAGLPGAFHGETVTRRRLMTGGAHAAAAVAGAAIVLPAAGFAVGPVFERERASGGMSAGWPTSRSTRTCRG